MIIKVNDGSGSETLGKLGLEEVKKEICKKVEPVDVLEVEFQEGAFEDLFKSRKLKAKSKPTKAKDPKKEIQSALRR